MFKPRPLPGDQRQARIPDSLPWTVATLSQGPEQRSQAGDSPANSEFNYGLLKRSFQFPFPP